MKSVWNGKNKKILFLVIFTGMILLPGCDDSPTRPVKDFILIRGTGIGGGYRCVSRIKSH